MFKKISLLIISSCSLSLQALTVINHSNQAITLQFDYNIPPEPRNIEFAIGQTQDIEIPKNAIAVTFTGEKWTRTNYIPIAELSGMSTITLYPVEKGRGTIPYQIQKQEKPKEIKEEGEVSALRNEVSQLKAELATCKQQLRKALPSAPGGL